MMNLEKFFSQIPDKSFYDEKFYQKYLKSLHLYWHGQKDEAVSYACDVIEEDFDHQHIHLFYRLWIEKLCDDHDHESLHELRKHLLKISGFKPDFTTWASLRGIVHLELDELDTCYFIAKGLGAHKENPYCLEFKQKLALRVAKNTSFPLFLLKTEGPILDYFHWQSTASGLLIQNELKLLDELLHGASRVFAYSPLQDTFLFFKHMDHGKLKEASNTAKALHRNFPEHTLYLFYYGYSRLCLKDYKGAQSSLKEFLDGEPNDVDALNLLAYSHLLKSRDDVASPDWHKAKKNFLLALDLLQAQGLPTDETRMHLLSMEKRESLAPSKRETTNLTQGMELPRQYWGIVLSPRRFDELAHSQERDISILKQSMGLGSQPDDVVFFLGNSDQKTYKLLAAYKVMSESFWHPWDQYHTLLELVHRFEKPVHLNEPIRLSRRDLTLQGKSIKANPEKFQVYSLDDNNVRILKSQLDESETSTLPSLWSDEMMNSSSQVGMTA